MTMLQNADHQERLTHEDKNFLKKYFIINPKPTTLQRTELAIKLNVSKCKIRNWFQNRRAKERWGGSEAVRNDISANFDIDQVYPFCNSLYIRKDVV